jgi:soluble lytic murein transglycosylase-like protein
VRWANEETWQSVVEEAARRHGVPPELVLAVIATESQFRPDAIRNEPKLGDASRGLMQILYRTAVGEGYAGTPEGLLDPATNIEYGTRYLARQYKRAGGDWRRAASAYNGGYRPSLGFGAPAPADLTVCLARDQVTGECIKSRRVAKGEFANQPYVDAVGANLTYFESKRSARGPLPSPTTESGGVNWRLVAMLTGLLGGLLIFRRMG